MDVNRNSFFSHQFKLLSLLLKSQSMEEVDGFFYGIFPWLSLFFTLLINVKPDLTKNV